MFSIAPSAAIPTTPLVLSDRLLTLAQQADQAGCRGTAGMLVVLAQRVLEERAGHRRRAVPRKTVSVS